MKQLSDGVSTKFLIKGMSSLLRSGRKTSFFYKGYWEWFHLKNFTRATWGSLCPARMLLDKVVNTKDGDLSTYLLNAQSPYRQDGVLKTCDTNNVIITQLFPDVEKDEILFRGQIFGWGQIPGLNQGWKWWEFMRLWTHFYESYNKTWRWSKRAYRKRWM